MSIANPVNEFIDGNNQRAYTFKAGAKAYHFSPNASGLSQVMDCNILFFADDEDHAREILKGMFEHIIDCLEKLEASERGKNSYRGESGTKGVAAKYLAGIDQWVITEASLDQIFKVSWADNDRVL